MSGEVQVPLNSLRCHSFVTTWNSC